METQIIPADLVARKICLVRGHKVMLDRDLVELLRGGDQGAQSGGAQEYRALP